MPTIWERLKMASQAFREAWLYGSPLDFDDFALYENRITRYDLLWRVFENSSYRKIHAWARGYSTTFGLYKYTRHIYNPAYRLAMFYRSHIMGGKLDPLAGDGVLVPSTLPIIIPEANADADRLRAAIADVWKWSHWKRKKDTYTLQGSIFGDVAIKVVDDPGRGRVYLVLIHPGTIKDLTLDPFGNVKGYVLQEGRPDPRDKDQKRVVTYREEAARDGLDVVYSTFLDGQPYAWGESATWTVPYGFVPLVYAQHLDTGLPWGWSELHAGLPKIREADDLASKLHDQVRKTIDPIWFFAGVDGAATTEIPLTEGTNASPEVARQDIPALYGPLQATATPLVAPLDIRGTLDTIRELLVELERDYPELRLDRSRGSSGGQGGEQSGKAIREARAEVNDKILDRRVAYDDTLARAQQMAIAISGWRRYPGYEPFGLDSFGQGALDHAIGDRPVFNEDPLEVAELDQKFWTGAKAAVDAGATLAGYLKSKGWEDEDIVAIVDADREAAALAMLTSGLALPPPDPRIGAGEE